MARLTQVTVVQLAAILSLFAASAFCAVSSTATQSTSGSISGNVFDPSGSPLADAKVTIVNEENGNARATRSDRLGFYIVFALTPGVYTVTASAPGFADQTVPHVRIELNKRNVVLPPITLKTPGPPSSATPVPSSSASPASEIQLLINISDPTRRGNFVERQLESLPLGGPTQMRSFDEIALLVAGVAPPPYTPGVRGPGVGFGIGTAGQFSVNGSRSRSNNFTVDGSDNNDTDVGVRRQGFIALVPQPIDSIQEFQISTLLWDAESGRNIGSQVNAVSRGGGNRFHGEGFGFFTDSRLNARNFFDYTGAFSRDKDPFTRSQEGFVIGGPIVGDRTQFFGSFERLDVNSSTEQHFSTPTADERNFRSFLGRVLGTTTPDTFAVRHPFPAAPPNLDFGTPLGGTPLGTNILSLYPLPNNPGGPYGANTYTAVLPSGGEGTIFSLKATHQVAKDSSLNVRYNFTDDSQLLPSVNRAIRSTIRSGTRTQNLALIYDSALTPVLSTVARFSYGRTQLQFDEVPGSPFRFQAASNVLVGNEVFPSRTGPMGEVIIEPFSPVGVDVFSFPQGRASNVFQFADTLSRKMADHSIKFGADIRRDQLNSFQDRNYRPLVVYGNGALIFGNFIQSGPFEPIRFKPNPGQLFLPGVQLANIGIPSSIFQTISRGVPDSHIGLRQTEYNFFLNDNWRVRSDLTLDYGLRYEYNTVPQEVNNRIEDAITLRNLPSPGSSVFDTRDRTAAFDAAVNAYRSVLAGRRRIYQPDRRNFAPHVGFAWRPGAANKTSLRGGYGLYYDAILGAVVSQSRNVFPTEIPINVDPTFLGFSIFDLNNPSFLRLTDPRAVSLILSGTTNQFGGAPEDFPALIGLTFAQNTKGGGLAFTLPEKNLRTPYVQQWHLTLEREIASGYLVSAAYVGTKGTKLTRLTTPNLGPNVTLSIPVALGTGAPGVIFPIAPTIDADSAISIRRDRPLPGLGAYQVFENSANSNYHALQLEARSRYKHGYTLTAAYTWSHSIDDVSDVFPIAGAPILPQDSFNLRLERASSNFDVRHHFTTSLIWDLPFYRNTNSDSRWRWLGGWQLASIFQAYTGQPFTLILPIDANLDGNLTDRPSTTDGLVFFSGHGRQKVAMAPGRDITDFFVLGRDGAVGRNTVRADSFVNWDVALRRRFSFSERQKLDFRAEFFNVPNRANFGIPIRTLGSPGFGSAVETANPARIIQFALKYKF